MTKKVTIVGAGLAGLLAANMLRRSEAVVIEAQPSLPNNHHAVLRFRTDRVALQTGIPFRKVKVHKAIHNPINPVADALAYSNKVLGRTELRSVINTDPADRYIAPANLISRMAEGLNINFSTFFGREYQGREEGPIISTMPMERMMDILEYDGPRPEFRYEGGMVIKAKLRDCDVFATIYYPHSMRCYRASITGNELSIEFGGFQSDLLPGDAPIMVAQVLKTFGLSGDSIEGDITFHTQKYAKISRMSDADTRKARDFMFWATLHFQIYSLGRFATWRAGLLLDDVVADVAKIEGWMRSGSYALKKDV